MRFVKIVKTINRVSNFSKKKDHFQIKNFISKIILFTLHHSFRKQILFLVNQKFHTIVSHTTPYFPFLTFFYFTKCEPFHETR